MSSDRLLTEVERQRKYLSRLPEDFPFPLFNAQQALESQRRSGYRNTASAAREIVDNAIEAGADKVHIIFERPNPKQLKAYQRADSVSAVAFIDNGSGMLPEMARYALSWGSGTHFDDPAFIGRFGFGLPNASINQTRLVAVYTKTADAQVITKAELDIREVQQHGLQFIEPPVEAKLPAFVQNYLDREGMAFDHGTVVVWFQPDRLQPRTAGSLREHLVDDFGVTYRYLLEQFELVVEGTRVDPVDPLFLYPQGRYFVPTEEGGAELSKDWNIAVKYFRDKETGALHLQKVDDPEELNLDDVDLLATGAIVVRVSRFPKGFAEPNTGKLETDAHRRFEIRKTRRGMSFVRAGREIETVDGFPKSVKDEAKGLGKWPLLQSYAYHWGVEVKFDPELDEVFGITNDKQTVRPIEDLWRLLAKEEVDGQLQREQAWQRKMRARPPVTEAAASETATPAETAAAKADTVIGQRPKVTDRDKPKVRKQLDEEAKKRVGVTGESIDKARKAIEDAAKRRPYKIDFFEEPRGPFYRPEWESGSRVVVLINRQHAFFQEFYGPLLKLPHGGQAKQALDVLLIALARAELIIDDEDCANWYVAQRERVWSTFLGDALKVLQQTMQPKEEESAEHAADAVNEDGADLAEAS